MAFRAYYREDIHAAIEGSRTANSGQNKLLLSIVDDPRIIVLLAAYQAGYNTALNSIGEIFGVGEKQDVSRLLKLLDQLNCLEAVS